jgi:hypothetical protein
VDFLGFTGCIVSCYSARHLCLSSSIEERKTNYE